MMLRATSRRRLAVIFAVVLSVGALLLATSVPVLDEESYLDIASQLDPLRPYDWWRPWQPWGTDREADAFVYAHPPLHLLWVYLVRGLVPEELGLRALKVLAGAPWAMLYGWAVGSLAGQLTRRPLLAVLTWASAPIVVLGMQRGLMPDLALAALCTAGVAGWRLGLHGHRLASVLGGLALAGAIWTKYPAALLVPVLLVHGRLALGSWSRLASASGSFWLAALVPVAAGEAWLAVTYGRVHPVEVISRAGEISRGDVRVRVLGVLARLSLGVVPAALLVRGLRRSLLIGAAVGSGALLLAWGPAQLDVVTALRVWPFVTLGAAVVVSLAVIVSAPGADRGPGERGDGVLLALWAAVWIAGVLLVHNFSAPRYLLPAMVPIALLLTRAVDARQSARALLLTGATLGVVASANLTQAEHRFFEAADALAGQIARTWQSPGTFTGEWSFRHRMTQEGWSFLDEDAPSGVLVVAPINSSPGALPEVKEHVADYAYDVGSLRVLCAECRIGLYGETLGVVPIGWSTGPLEQASAWRLK